jgi:hypothetical protein
MHYRAPEKKIHLSISIKFKHENTPLFATISFLIGLYSGNSDAAAFSDAFADVVDEVVATHRMATSCNRKCPLVGPDQAADAPLRAKHSTAGADNCVTRFRSRNIMTVEDVASDRQDGRLADYERKRRCNGSRLARQSAKTPVAKTE